MGKPTSPPRSHTTGFWNSKHSHTLDWTLGLEVDIENTRKVPSLGTFKTRLKKAGSDSCPLTLNGWTRWDPRGLFHTRVGVGLERRLERETGTFLPSVRHSSGQSVFTGDWVTPQKLMASALFQSF